MNYNDLLELIQEYINYGSPVIGIIFPAIESLLPIFPLFVIVIINVTVFGLFWGYLYSWIGNCIGTFLLFLLVRKIGGGKIENRINKSRYDELFKKIKKKNLSILFILYCFPFTPSFLLTGTAALTNVSSDKFIFTMLPSKLIMMASLALIGENVNSFFEKPLKSLFLIIFIILINIIGKFFLYKLGSNYRKK